MASSGAPISVGDTLGTTRVENWLASQESSLSLQFSYPRGMRTRAWQSLVR